MHRHEETRPAVPEDECRVEKGLKSSTIGEKKAERGRREGGGISPSLGDRGQRIGGTTVSVLQRKLRRVMFPLG